MGLTSQVGTSFQNEVAVPSRPAWGANNASLQQRDVNAAECSYNATNGIETSEASLSASSLSFSQAVPIQSVVMRVITGFP